MTNTLHQSISKMCPRAASATVTLAVMLVLGVVATQSAQAQTFTVLYSFTGWPDGAFPDAGLVRDTAGNLYGTTGAGGSFGYGTVFKVDPSGTETVLYSFAGYPEGEVPYAGLVRDAKGNLYGTTSQGGSDRDGVVFKVDTSGTETVLYSFAGGTTDGCYPFGGLLRDKAGNLYGTTAGCGASYWGTVFKLDTTGKETVLHNFAGGSSDGAVPYTTGLLRDTVGNLYGVTEEGGPGSCEDGCGTVFKLDTAGKEIILHSFTGGTTDGCYPVGTLVNDAEGNLYGTTGACGSSSLGIAWKVSTKGAETVLHNFTGENGVYPAAGVIMDSKGNLYGDTSNGGPSSAGVVYKLSKTGKETVLHSFTGGSDGGDPYAGLVRDAAGNLYGTALEGGSSAYGTVWKLTP